VKELMEYLPLLNLLVVPVFLAYVRHEVKLKVLEIHKKRVEIHLGFDERRSDYGD